MSAAAYAAHLNNAVLPALNATREEIARLETDIAEYEQVARRLQRLLDKDDKGKRRAPTELGGGVWVDAVVPDTSTVTLDLGLEVHLPLPTAEAAEFATKRAELLKKKRDAVGKREERLRWEIEQFEGALKEVSNREGAV